MFMQLNFKNKIIVVNAIISALILVPVFYFLFSYLEFKLNGYMKNENAKDITILSRQIKNKVQLAQNSVFNLIYRFNKISKYDRTAHEEINTAVRNLLSHTEDVSDIWVILDKDGLQIEPEYESMAFSDTMATEFPIWSYEARGVEYILPNLYKADYFPNLFKIIKDTKRPIIGESPHLSNSESSKLLPIATPIFRNGEFIGVLGFHLKLTSLEDEIENAVSPNDNSALLIVSHQSQILAHTDRNKIGETFTSLQSDYEDGALKDVNRAIKGGYRYEGSIRSQTLSEDMMLIFDPIYFKDQRVSWAMGIIYPKDLVLAQQFPFQKYLFLIVLLSLGVIIAIISLLLRKKLKPLSEYLAYADKAAKGFYLQELPAKYLNINGEIGDLYNALKKLQDNLRKKENLTMQKFDEQNKLNIGVKLLLEIMRGDQRIDHLSKKIINFLSEYINAKSGSIFLFNPEKNRLELISAYALDRRKALNNTIELGEGVLGQAAKEKQIIILEDVPEDYLLIDSALGETPARNIIAAPFIYEDNLIGVIELATYNKFGSAQVSFIKSCLENIAIVFNSSKSNDRIKELYAEAQHQAEQLQTQQEELMATNEELEAQTKALILSERKLLEQKEELQAINEELEEKTGFLEKQKAEIIKKNEALMLAQYQLSQKANEVQLASTYKSEFLANMSHELRTPLNSILILTNNLIDDSVNQLTAEQKESAGIIYQCGIDLMNLINDILDLSKIEAGKMNIKFAPVEIMHIVSSVRNNFSKQIESKNLQFNIRTSPDIPKEIETDTMRLEQIIKNFISNSIKFTKQGSINFLVELIETPKELLNKFKVNKLVKFSVQDTGIGIPEDKQKLIFEAFRQIETSITRSYGGTGLGLYIAKELANALGGDITLESRAGYGSTFSLLVPLAKLDLSESKDSENTDASIDKNNNQQTIVQIQPAVRERKLISDLVQIKYNNQTEQQATDYKQTETQKDNNNQLYYLSKDDKYKAIIDDRYNLLDSDKAILIVEDDAIFAKILVDQVRSKGFGVLFAPSGEEALITAKQFNPSAIILDIKLPGIDGWEVLRKLKENHRTRHIPVHMMSGEGDSLSAKKQGAVGFINKPTTKDKLDKALMSLEGVIEKKIKDLLIIEDDQYLRKSIVGLLTADDVSTYEASTATQALTIIRDRNIDCIVLDLTLPDMNGFDLLTMLKHEDDLHIPPVIVYTGKELSKEEEGRIMQFAESIIIKGVKSEERLMDETALFLHRVADKIEIKNADSVVSIHDKDFVFRGKTVLLVDDDNRNSYALSKVMIDKELNVLIADNGENALKMLKDNPGIDLVLMDIMMPIMDGLTAIEQIRKTLKMTKIPVIALTAKAMKEDREKCITAGANDYLAKPIEIDKLFSLLRVWLYQL